MQLYSWQTDGPAGYMTTHNTKQWLSLVVLGALITVPLTQGNSAGDPAVERACAVLDATPANVNINKLHKTKHTSHFHKHSRDKVLILGGSTAFPM